MRLINTGLAFLFALALLFQPAGSVQAHGSQPEDPLTGVSFDQKLDAQLPLNTPFRDEGGTLVHLSDYFNQGPVILQIAYYNCPMLCDQVFKEIAQDIPKIGLKLGGQYQIVTISMDARETPAMAAAKKNEIFTSYSLPEGKEAWHFLTGDDAAIHQISEIAGFHFVYDPEQDQFSHPTGIILLTPQGKISRYYFGIQYAPADLRLGLVEASQRKIGNPVDQFFLLCYHYNPVTGRYTLFINNIIRILAFATVLILAGGILYLLRGPKSRQLSHP